MVLARCRWAWQRQTSRWHDRCLWHLVRRMEQGHHGTPEAPFIPTWWRTLDAWWYGASGVVLVHAMLWAMLGMAWTVRHDLVANYQPGWNAGVRWTHLDPAVLGTPFWQGVTQAAVLGWGLWVLMTALPSPSSADRRSSPSPRSPTVRRLSGVALPLCRCIVPILVLSLLWGRPWQAFGIVPLRPLPGTPMITLAFDGQSLGAVPTPTVLIPFTVGTLVIIIGCEHLVTAGVLVLRRVLRGPRAMADHLAYGRRQRAAHYQEVDLVARRLFEQRQLVAVATTAMASSEDAHEAPSLRGRRRL